VSAGAVILATGACGRLGLPASGHLYGTYENPTNAGDGYSMAYHAGAELSGIECFQINPLIKHYNGPACAYVGNPFGAYQVNDLGERFVDCDYWSGQMMAEVASEIASARGPIYLKVTHLPEESISALEGILHHGTAFAWNFPRGPRTRLPDARHRDAHFRDRVVRRAFRVGCVG
jgi:succinate dehydrogenase/fumarate reductase flavoprotein subunit